MGIHTGMCAYINTHTHVQLLRSLQSQRTATVQNNCQPGIISEAKWEPRKGAGLWATLLGMVRRAPQKSQVLR